MQKLFVYADFDWLDAPCLVCELSCDSVRGSGTYAFAYEKDWLARYSDIFLWRRFIAISWHAVHSCRSRYFRMFLRRVARQVGTYFAESP